jgi:hypothetical protein
VTCVTFLSPLVRGTGASTIKSTEGPNGTKNRTQPTTLNARKERASHYYEILTVGVYDLTLSVSKGVDGRVSMSEPAIHLRSVCWTTTAFRVLRCHPWPCMLLNLHFVVVSNPIAPTIFFKQLPLMSPLPTTACSFVPPFLMSAGAQKNVTNRASLSYTPQR